MRAMKLISDSFSAGGRIPAEFTCEGADRSPHLAWTGAPAGTRSFALIIDDPDAPGRTWTHWGLYDIPADQTRLDAGFSRQSKGTGVAQALNDFRCADYGGPCPPPGHGVHRYRFRVFALGVEHLALKPSADCRALEGALRPHVLAEAELTGTYSR
jgi:Raf kinase inhibitor-like YbhB/YbcL family protein